MMCSGLSLLGSFPKALATRLLPSIAPLLAGLHAAANLPSQLAAPQCSPCPDAHEDFCLSGKPWVVESAHPYTAGGGFTRELKAADHSSCLRLQLDSKSCTFGDEACLEVWCDGRLVHAFSGPRGRWPKTPLVITSSHATLHFRVNRTLTSVSTRQRRHKAWGFAFVVQEYEPSLTPGFPLVVDCLKSVANLGGKYAANLMVGEPLSPEERMYTDDLEAMEIAMEPSSGVEAWAGCRIPTHVRAGLYEKRQRRAISRAAGLEAFLQQLSAAPAPTIQRHVLLHLAQAIRSLQQADGKSRVPCQFMHGCRGCDRVIWEQIRTTFVRLFQVLGRRLNECLDAFVSMHQAVRPDNTSENEGWSLLPTWQGVEDTLLVLSNAFLLRLRPDDFELLQAADLLKPLCRLGYVGGRPRTACRQLFSLLALSAFSHSKSAPPTSFQLGLLATKQRELTWALHRHPRCQGVHITAVLSLLHTISSSRAVCALLAKKWMPSLLHLMKVQTTAIACRVLRLLRSILLAIDPNGPAMQEHIDASVKQVWGTLSSPLNAVTGGLQGTSLKEACGLVHLLLEAIGREIAGDTPLVAQCLDSVDAVQAAISKLGDTEAISEATTGTESTSSNRAPCTDAAAASRVGSPNGRIVSELISLLRLLQRSTNKAWTAKIGQALAAAFSLVPAALAALDPTAEVSRNASAPKPTHVVAESVWLVLGALSVAGGHFEAVQPGIRVIGRSDAMRGTFTVLEVGKTTALLVTDSSQPPLATRKASLTDLRAVPEFDAGIEGLDLRQIVPAIVSLLPTRPPSRCSLPELGLASAVRRPLVAAVRSRAAKVLHELLASHAGAWVGDALLRDDCLPQLLDVAATTVPSFFTASSTHQQLEFTELLSLSLDATIADAAPSARHVHEVMPGSVRVESTLRLGVELPAELERDDHILELCGLGLSPKACIEALNAHPDVHEAAQSLIHVNGAAGVSEAEKQLLRLTSQLEAMGFPNEQCVRALQRVGNDVQRAADWLLDGGGVLTEDSDCAGSGVGATSLSGGSGSAGEQSDGHGAGDSSMGATAQLSETRPSPSPGTGGATSSGPVAYESGDAVELCDEAEHTRWQQAEIAEVTEAALQLRLVGWCEEWSEWVPRSSPRIRRPTGKATAGPLANANRVESGNEQSNRQQQEHSGAASSSACSTEMASSSSSSSTTPTGASRAGGRWFWPSRIRDKRRTAAEQASLTACPTAAADFFTSDLGLSRVIDQNPLQTELGPGMVDGAASLALSQGARVRVARGSDTGRVGVIVGEEARESSLSAMKYRVLVAAEDGAVIHTMERHELEPPQQQLSRIAPAVGARTLASLARMSCTLHEALAVLHCRRAVLALLCEVEWLRAADADPQSRFELSSLDGQLQLIVRVLKLASIAEPNEEYPEAGASPNDGSAMVCVVLSLLLNDSERLLSETSVTKLHELLAVECMRYLARSATCAQHAESTHPSEPTMDELFVLSCPGASMMQLIFDSRSWLSRGSTLTVFFDAACTHHAFTFDSDDLLTAETLCVPVDRVWMQYYCEQNRDHAWGFKLHVQPLRWCVRNEVAIADGPFEFGWELMQLLVDDAPSAMAHPAMLANMLRYLLHGRAPHKERVCMLMLKTLPALQVDTLALDVVGLQALEQHIAWHDALLKQPLPLEGTALLPMATQCMLDLLLEARECMNAQGVVPWPSALSFTSEVAELSALTKWLLAPTRNSCPRASAKLAARAAGQPDINLEVYNRWLTRFDVVLVGLVDSTSHGSGTALSMRTSQIATLSEQARDASSSIGAFTPAEVAMRLALLQRFNQLVSRHLSLVHTGITRKPNTLGDRLCRLRGAILLETKLSALEKALASTVSDTDVTPVELNRFKASRLRARAEAGRTGDGTLFVQVHEQLGRVKTRSLFRHDKAFKVNFVGEAADDHGGPYREAIAALCAELQSGALPLFQRCPNGKNGVGEQRDSYVPDPSACTPQQLEWFAFVGNLLGLSLRQKETQMPLSLPSVVWKQLVSEPMDASDLAAFDAMCKQSLDKLRAIADEGIDADTFGDVIFERFTTQLSDGSEVALLPNGHTIDVTFDNRLAFCDAVLQARLNEAQQQCDAILQGLSSVVPQRMLSLFTWQQLELLTCGARDIDLEVLRSKTKYGVGVSPSQRHVRYLWQALRRFTPENRAAFLRFVWGRTRLPATPTEWGDVRFTLHTRHSSNPDAAFPVAHTCFFSLELPAYTSYAVTHERLLYAITNCAPQPSNRSRSSLEATRSTHGRSDRRPLTRACVPHFARHRHRH